MNMFIAGVTLALAVVNVMIGNRLLAAGCLAACVLNMVVHYYA